MALKRMVLQIGMGTDIRTTDRIFTSRALNGPACRCAIRLGTAFWSPMMSMSQRSCAIRRGGV